MVIDRGPSPYLSNIDLYLDGKLITSVQVKTDRPRDCLSHQNSCYRATDWSCPHRREAQHMQWPRGRAWSTQASLRSWSPPSVHTPSHSGAVSFLLLFSISRKLCRPIVVPAGVELKISVSPDSRNTAWVSFDGRKRQELCHGDSLRVTTSIYPIPSICAQVSQNNQNVLPQTMASGPDHRLVWLLGRVLALECEEEATNPWRAEWLVERSICCLGQGTTPNFDFNEFCYLVVTYLLLNISLFRRHSRNCCFPSGQNSTNYTYVLDAISWSMSDLRAESKT